MTLERYFELCREKYKNISDITLPQHYAIFPINIHKNNKNGNNKNDF